MANKGRARLLDWERSTEEDLKKAVRKLVLRPELVRRVLFESSQLEGRRCSDPQTLFQVVGALLWGQEDEHFVVVALDNGMNLIDAAALTKGSAAFTVVDARQVMRWLLTRERQPLAFAVAHNHPSGVLEPSPQDKQVTKKIAESAETLSLQFLDHLILGGSSYYSMREGGESPWGKKR